jgi:hypothetical protein
MYALSFVIKVISPDHVCVAIIEPHQDSWIQHSHLQKRLDLACCYFLPLFIVAVNSATSKLIYMTLSRYDMYCLRHASTGIVQ